MFNSGARRLVAVMLLIASLVLVPASVALADDSGSSQAAESEDQGIVQDAIDWLLQLFGMLERGGDNQGQMDPMGLA